MLIGGGLSLEGSLKGGTTVYIAVEELIKLHVSQLYRNNVVVFFYLQLLQCTCTCVHIKQSDKMKYTCAFIIFTAFTINTGTFIDLQLLQQVDLLQLGRNYLASEENNSSKLNWSTI